MALEQALAVTTKRPLNEEFVGMNIGAATSLRTRNLRPVVKTQSVAVTQHEALNARKLVVSETATSRHYGEREERIRHERLFVS